LYLYRTYFRLAVADTILVDGSIIAKFLFLEPLAKPSEAQQNSPAADLSESYSIHALT